MTLISASEARAKLLARLQEKSVFRGDFTLSSGAKSSYYIDCRLTTLDTEAAWWVGIVMWDLIQAEARTRNVDPRAMGGLTMGADPIALATGMVSMAQGGGTGLQAFTVRKAPKGHGQTKLIEGNFRDGQTVVVVDDVITTGESTLKAIEAIRQEGGRVAFAAVLVDRQEGGHARIEKAGTGVVAAFTREELLGSS